jgi:hypothetical protein
MADTFSHSSMRSQDGTGTLPGATYAQLLSQDLEWAMNEGSEFFQDRGSVQQTLRRISTKLDELGIPYAIAGGMALFMHGFRRFTEDVDILVTQDGLVQLHQQLDGRGFVRPFEKSKNLRDTETKVKIEFLISGQFPGDGKPKPVAFPDPVKVSERRAGISILDLETLIELKLASGMTSEHRAKDLADVGELIGTLKLPQDFATRLNPFVRDRFSELWKLHGKLLRYILVFPTAEPGDERQKARLEQMLADGVLIESAPDRTLMEGYLLLFTTDRELASKYGMTPEDEYFDTDQRT